MLLMIWQIVVEIICFVLTGVLNQSTNNGNQRNYFQSISDVQHLLELNRKLTSNLNIYATQLQQKSEMLNRLAKELQNSIQVAEDNESEHLVNPLNLYSLIRHMHVDWPQLQKFIEQPVEPVDFIKESYAELPTDDDIQEFTFAMNRIQTIYGLEPADMVNGLLNGVQYNTRLSPLDCYEMGKINFEATQYDNATAWLIMAQNLLDDKSQSAFYELLGVTQMNIQLMLTNVSAQAEALLHNSKPNESIPEDPEITEIIENFKRLCRNSFQPKTTRLNCFYKTTPAYFLRIAPVKMELLSLDPFVAVFHNVIYESEIAELKKLSHELLRPAGIVDENTKLVTSKYRIANSAWLSRWKNSTEEFNVTNRIQERIEDMTEMLLDDYMNSALQLLEYGFGGYYSPHFDYFNETSSPVLRDDRIATLLFYLNDVPNGGITAFPKLELAVRPELGKALFWHNLKPGSYDFDTRSIHGACPILNGTKLALTQWIHENDQMFLRPCLKPPEYRQYNYN